MTDYLPFLSPMKSTRPTGLWMFSRLALFCLFLFARPLLADTITINFEGFADGTAITTQYAGITFSNATIQTAGVSLNEFEFPPHSGVNVVFDNGGPITITFGSAVTGVGAFFTYAMPLTVEAFNSAGTMIASTNSLFSSNEALSGVAGSSPNEFIQVGSPSGISSIEIFGSSSGTSLVMDDLTYSSVPEPGSLALLLTGMAPLIVSRIRNYLPEHKQKTR